MNKKRKVENFSLEGNISVSGDGEAFTVFDEDIRIYPGDKLALISKNGNTLTIEFEEAILIEKGSKLTITVVDGKPSMKIEKDVED